MTWEEAACCARYSESCDTDAGLRWIFNVRKTLLKRSELLTGLGALLGMHRPLGLLGGLGRKTHRELASWYRGNFWDDSKYLGAVGSWATCKSDGLRLLSDSLIQPHWSYKWYGFSSHHLGGYCTDSMPQATAQAWEGRKPQPCCCFGSAALAALQCDCALVFFSGSQLRFEDSGLSLTSWGQQWSASPVPTNASSGLCCKSHSCVPTQLSLILQNLSWGAALSNQTENTWFMLWLLTRGLEVGYFCCSCHLWKSLF